MKKRGPKVKLSRKLGIPLTSKAPRVMSRNPSPQDSVASASALLGYESEYKRQVMGSRSYLPDLGNPRQHIWEGVTKYGKPVQAE